MLETATCSGCWRRFGYLRSLQWRIDLGILPSSPSASIDDLRRFTADSRRRYASLRKKLLIDPHFPKDGVKSGDLTMDDPLSQNPDSMWGQFFRNAELERMLDQDLSRLYPERGSYFQTSGCQGMLRRILLLWCVRNPEYGYRQGMHELLAPLLYVLQVDIERHLEVRKTYENHFADKFDDENHQLTFDFNKFSENGSEKDASLDPEIQTIVSLSDAYGAEGELGVVLSDKFMEHDAYSMFDALLSGSGGPISMAEFFSPIGGTGIPPVIEASRAVYHLLSVADPSLYGHLVGLEVEPQYFLLRWLRVLFGREFSLEDLLIIWDEIFSHENAVDSSMGSSFGILESRRGTFICAFAVSMMLFLRSSLLAAEFTTAPLQRLLNYPDEVDVRRLLKKANDLISRVAVSKKPAFLSPVAREEKPPDRRTSPGTPSYWEEKWRDLHGGEEESGDDKERLGFRLSGNDEDPPSVRRNLMRDFEQNDDSNPKTGSKKKFHQWIWGSGGKTREEEGKTASSSSSSSSQKANENEASSSSSSSSTSSAVDQQNVMVSLKNLGQSMLENIQLIESVFQQDNNNNNNNNVQQQHLKGGGLKNGLVEKGQITAFNALKELRKISNVLLSEM